MKTIALATCRSLADLAPDEKLLADRLRDLGFEARPLVWDDSAQQLHDVAAVIVRSCWDYHKKPQEFLSWAEGLEAQGMNVLNPSPILRGNHDKSYLRQLQAADVRVPSTAWFEPGSTAVLAAVLAKHGWSKAVVKPTISATAWQTFSVSKTDAASFQLRFEELLGTGGVLVQSFVDEIEITGEWSFVFFDRTFSHAVRKRPKPGDFRVQEQFGGSVEPITNPARTLVAQAEAILAQITGPLVYARVDAVETEGQLCLMELELIEPALFLQTCPHAAKDFAAAIVRAVPSTSRGSRSLFLEPRQSSRSDEKLSNTGVTE
jgi:glutathione synthase/RimK-type ligase-like ATP-grasp enzyme